MRWSVAKTLSTLILLGICSGQVQSPPANPPHSVEINVPDGVPSQSMFIRYVLDSEDFGGWVRPHPGISSYLIDTTRAGRTANRIRAILYAPGCAIQTLDLLLSGSKAQRYSFVCTPLSNVWILGTLTRTDRLYGHEVKVGANYVARWAQSFLGLGAGILTTIPVGGEATVSPNGSFRLSVPDFSQDPSAGVTDYPGELQLWAKDKTSDKIVAQLIPVGDPGNKTRMGGLRIRGEYAEMVFAPCAANPRQRHDAIGFAQRPDAKDSCDR